MKELKINLLKIDHTVLQVWDIERMKEHLYSIFGFRFSIHPSSKNTWGVESGDTHFFIKKTFLPSLHQQHISFEVDELGPVAEKLKTLAIASKTGLYTGFQTGNYYWLEWNVEGIRLECTKKI